MELVFLILAILVPTELPLLLHNNTELSTLTMLTKRYVHLDHGVSGTLSVARGVENMKRKSNPITDQERPWRFQKVEAPRFQDSRHVKVVRLSAVRTGRLHP